MEIKFYIKDKSKNKSSVILSVSHLRRRQKFPTGISIKSEEFSNRVFAGKERRATRTPFRSESLKVVYKLGESIAELYDKLRIQKGMELNINEVKEICRRVLKQSAAGKKKELSFMAFIDEWIEEIAPLRSGNSREGKSEGTKVSSRTIITYKSAINKLKTFYTLSPFDFEDIDIQFYKELYKFFITEQGLQPSTFSNLIKNLKVMLRDAEKHPLYSSRVNQDYKDSSFKKPTNKTVHVYLNRDEIQKIIEVDLSSSPHLDNARDLMLIGLHTGLRISDFKRLNRDSIQDGIIEITAHKTGKRTLIPVHHVIEEIIKKRGGLPKKISDQRFNEYIKKVCCMAGINNLEKGSIATIVELYITNEKGKKEKVKVKRSIEGMYEKWRLVASHTCRRSWATNYFGVLPISALMAITGHSTQEMFFKYIKKTPEDHLDAVKRVYEEERERAIEKAKELKRA